MTLRSLRLAGESDAAFRGRAEQTARYARMLVDAALANCCIREFIADEGLPFTENGERRNPTVRIEYEQAIAIGGIGECLQATRNKHWGDGPYVHPLRRDDPVDPCRILYLYKEGSLYNRRFEQRQRMKQLLGKRFRHLVEKAKYHRPTKKVFLANLTTEQAEAIRHIFDIEPGAFWQAARGKRFL